MEEEVNYASVVFKANKASPPKAKSEEETVYDEVKVQEKTTNQTADTPGVLPDGKSSSSCPHVQVVAWCLGILCVILLSAVIALCVYFATAIHERERLVSDLKADSDNLTNRINNLSSANDELRKDYSNLTILIGNRTHGNGILESRNKNLTTENLQLKTEKSNLERRIENMTGERNELNLTRAQWSLNAYCPKERNRRQCKACQQGWIHSPSLSSCYGIVDETNDSKQKTWEEAREDCRGKNSHLVIIGSLEEQEFIYANNYGRTSETSGYWIGLTDAAGSWKWVDGSDLTEDYWIKQPAANAHCAISLRKTSPYGWNAVDCTERNRWICEMKALSV
ncbi:C-type lectin domain family 10 member A-like isoform X2 [Centroberyx affinis]|uniref:C-type lectin domain family 10 member A-like isoform X2 n=1 Tax=Centroberyx affinis TaxID=166261 RepID=UPI003A5C34DF